MKDRILMGIVFLTGLTISGAAAYYSIVGLTAIFAGSFWPVVIMGSALEVGKLVAISWLYHYWDQAGKALKAYLFLAIGVLMIITSMGIYGFLSRAHIEHSLTLSTGAVTDLQLIDSRIENKKKDIADYDKQIDLIDKAVGNVVDSKKVKDAKDALKLSEGQRPNRDALVKKREDVQREMQTLLEDRVKIEAQVKKIEAEVGPIKYVAQLYFDDANNPDIIEKAIRGVILLLIFVFDPLAIVLMLCFNVSLKAQEKIEFFDMPMTRPSKPRRKPKHLRKRRNGKI